MNAIDRHFQQLAQQRADMRGNESFNFTSAELNTDLTRMTIDEQLEVMNQVNAGVVELEPKFIPLFETKERLGL